jgi:hypothetical protein
MYPFTDKEFKIQRWFNSKGFQGSAYDAANAYFKSKSGLNKGTLQDHINKTVSAFGFSGNMEDRLRAFFQYKAGISHPGDAERAFWNNTALDFSVTDGIDSFTKLMLHMDGADGSTTFTDSELAPTKTVTAVGNAQIDTAQSKFGGASGLFDGTGDYLTVPDSADWAVGSSSFTVDFWIRIGTLSDFRFYAQKTDADNFVLFYYDNTGKTINYYSQTAGASVLLFNVPWNPSTSTWYHIALERNVNTWNIYTDGTAQNKTLADGSYSGTIADFTGDLFLFADTDGSTSLNGWVDEFRWSTGVARYNSTNFTPRTTAYS